MTSLAYAFSIIDAMHLSSSIHAEIWGLHRSSRAERREEMHHELQDDLHMTGLLTGKKKEM
jgi:predicted outer membrane lipoprotein